MSDPHFGHKRIIELCNRPFKSVSHMNESILDNINATVSSRERLVILGDICMGGIEESMQYLSRILAGELVLVPGNHDRWSFAFKNNTKDEEAAAAKRAFWAEQFALVRGNTLVKEDMKPSFWYFEELAWDAPKTHSLAQALFSHYPYAGESDWKRDDRYDYLRAPDDGLPIIHGHVHEQWKVNGRQFNVGVDVNGFTPVSEDELVEWVEAL